MTTSLVFAAGKGSRMTGYEGNKTLLPLIPRESVTSGERPLLREVLENLPPGPKGVVVHHREEDVRSAVPDLVPPEGFIRQAELNGTGGALLAARRFLAAQRTTTCIITMGDVPLLRPEAYLRLLSEIEAGAAFALLAFEPVNKAKYGLIATEAGHPVGIVEWEYWHNYPEADQARLRFCNAGVYAAKREVLLPYIDRIEREKAHVVQKARDGRMVPVTEYFLTDLVEMMAGDGVPTALVEIPEEEVIGVDTPESLARVQGIYGERRTAS